VRRTPAKGGRAGTAAAPETAGPAAIARAAAGSGAGGTLGGSSEAAAAAAGEQLPALLELLHWKTDAPDLDALLGPLCAVLRASVARVGAAASASAAGGAAAGAAAAALDSDDEAGAEPRGAMCAPARAAAPCCRPGILAVTRAGVNP